MKKILCGILFFLFLAGVSEARIVERIVAVVEDEIIMMSELKEFIAANLGEAAERIPGEKMDAVQVYALDRLIEQKLLQNEVKKRGIEVTQEKVEQGISTIKERFASEEEFQLALQAQGLTEEEFRKNIAEEIAVATLVKREVSDHIRIEDEEIEASYLKNKEIFRVPPRVEISQILIRVGEDRWLAEAEKKGAELLEKLGEGADFASLAREHSDGPTAEAGGTLGLITRRELPPEIGEIVFALEVGEFSDLVVTPGGVHIFRLDARYEERQKELAEVEREIRRTLFARKMRQRYQEWLDALRNKSYVRIMLMELHD
ncbi:MAG: Foldase protein PrsA 2 [Syntrophomonadaceae bacterium]|nr:Foldase protein PrsA 2 [Bacillota bacterium]